MKIAIPKERRPHEQRVAATPETVKRFIGLGAEVAIEAGAGTQASYVDAAYEEAGAVIAPDAGGAFRDADLVLKVQRPMTAEEGRDELSQIPDGTTLVGLLNPYGAEFEMALRAYVRKRINAFALELAPRISRAQSMDVLSSQSNLAGYRAVIDAVYEFGRAMPMMMTAAGRINPAKVFVMGAGVAGLQAIATARRLGAVVSATDVRAAAKEQVESLGASFVMVESEETASAETAGGYAREMSEDYQRRQAELIAETIKTQDIVITTALIPGRPAPTLVTEEMVASMRPGSVIVDLAVEQGGNCPLSRPGKVTKRQGVSIVAPVNMPSRLAVDASALYARNILNFVTPMIDKESRSLAVDWDDEIISGTNLTRENEIVHPLFKPEPTPAPSVLTEEQPAEEQPAEEQKNKPDHAGA